MSLLSVSADDVLNFGHVITRVLTFNELVEYPVKATERRGSCSVYGSAPGAAKQLLSLALKISGLN